MTEGGIPIGSSIPSLKVRTRESDLCTNLRTKLDNHTSFGKTLLLFNLLNYVLCVQEQDIKEDNYDSDTRRERPAAREEVSFNAFKFQVISRKLLIPDFVVKFSSTRSFFLFVKFLPNIPT